MAYIVSWYEIIHSTIKVCHDVEPKPLILDVQRNNECTHWFYNNVFLFMSETYYGTVKMVQLPQIDMLHSVDNYYI